MQKKKLRKLVLGISLGALMAMMVMPVGATEMGNSETVSKNDVIMQVEATPAEVERMSIPLTLNVANDGAKLATNTDEKWYKFTITEPGYFKLAIGPGATADVNELGWGWDVSLFASSDIAKDLKTYREIKSEEVTDPLVFSKGTYYIRVRARYSGSAPVNQAIKVKVESVSNSNWLMEDDGTNSKANVIEVNKAYYSTTCLDDDVDWVKFTMATDGVIKLNFGASELADIDKLGWGWDNVIYDSDLNEIRKYRETKGALNGTYPSELLPLKAGTYYVKTQARYVGSAPTDQPYQIKIEFAAKNDWEAEYNKSHSLANSLTIDKGMHGLLYTSDDEDWFCFDLYDKSMVNPKFELGAETNTDQLGWGWNVSIYNPDLKEIVVYKEITSNFAAEALVLDPGHYYVKVQARYVGSAPVGCEYVLTVNAHTMTQQDKIAQFVTRMYTEVLNRKPDEEGLNTWVNGLASGKMDGASLARGFICSDEFTKRGLSNTNYINTLYKTFFNREPDAGGKENWMKLLNANTPRNEVLAGFVNSQEFANLCDSYAIARGTMEADGSNIYNAGVRNFVLRIYTKALKRDGETAGVEDWSHRINTKAMSPEDVAKSFFSSAEFINKNLNNEDYVETLYETFMGRASDAGGKADWVNRLNAGTSRTDVLEGFSRSQEFSNIMRSYGL